MAESSCSLPNRAIEIFKLLYRAMFHVFIPIAAFDVEQTKRTLVHWPATKVQHYKLPLPATTRRETIARSFVVPPGHRMPSHKNQTDFTGSHITPTYVKTDD